MGIKNRDTKTQLLHDLTSHGKDLGLGMGNGRSKEKRNRNGWAVRGRGVQPNGEDQCRMRQPLLLLVKSKVFP